MEILKEVMFWIIMIFHLIIEGVKFILDKTPSWVWIIIVIIGFEWHIRSVAREEAENKCSDLELRIDNLEDKINPPDDPF